MGHNEFIKSFPELSSTNTDHFGVFPVTNRGIQIWMPLRRYRDSNCVFRAYLACRHYQGGPPKYIDLVLWDSNYYRYPFVTRDATLEDSPAEFRQVYLRYQDIPNHAVTFDIDDSAIIANGFTCSRENPRNLTGNTFTLTNTNIFYVKTYSQELGDGGFEVYFGECFGLDWVHLDVIRYPTSWNDPLRVQLPGGALSIADAPSPVDSLGRLWVYHLQLPGSTWIVRIYRVAWERSKVRLRMEVLQDSCFQNGPDKWNAYDVEVSDFCVHVDHYCHDHS